MPTQALKPQELWIAKPSNYWCFLRDYGSKCFRGGAPPLAVPADTTVALKPIKLNLSPYNAPTRKPPPRPCLVPWKWAWQPRPLRVAQKQQTLPPPLLPIAKKYIAKPNSSPNY